jgi:proteasome accessory factor C
MSPGGFDKKAYRLKVILNLMSFLSNHRNVPVETVCSVFGMSTKELASAVNEILMCGLPPYTPSDYVAAWIEEGRVTVENAEFLRRPLGLTMAEAVSMKVMVDDFLRSSPGVFVEEAQSLSRKLGDLLGRRVSGEGAPTTAAGKVEAIETAVDESRALEIAYYNRAEDAITRRTVEPLALVDIDGVWYLVAHCRMRKAQRSFRVDRIREARLLDERFAPKKEFRLEEYRRKEMFHPTGRETAVRVRFGAESARWAEERWAEKVAEREADGSIVCEFRVGDMAWIADVVTEFAGDAGIVAPSEAKSAFRERIDAIVRMYEKG